MDTVSKLTRWGWREALCLCFVLAFSYLIILDSLVVAVILGGAIVLSLILRVVRSSSLWRTLFMFVLCGYIVLSRGFSYISLSAEFPQIPIYIGEALLIFCLLVIPHRSVVLEYLRIPFAGWLVAWMALGAGLTIPDLPIYGVNALRDAAIWYYAAFSYVGYAFATREQDKAALIRTLGLAFLLHLTYNAIYLFSIVDIRAISPRAPGSEFPLFTFRDDASAVQLVAGFLFSILVAKHLRWPSWSRWAFGLSQIVVFFFVQVRAAYVGLFLVSLCLIYLRWFRQVFRFTVMIPILAAGLTAGLAISVGLGGYFGGPGRILGEIATVFDMFGTGGYRYSRPEIAAANVQWRLEYWKAIIEDGTRTPLRFLFGRGFGPDLSPSPKFVGDPSRPNRNPHNIAATVFGRMGIAGLMLWVAFHVVFFWKVLQGLSLGRGSPGMRSEDLLVFLTLYIIMILGSSLFGVLLETPFMAIPYYFLIGVSLQVASEQSDRLNATTLMAAR